MRLQKFCKTHPTYQLRRPPRSACADCQRAWTLREGITASLRKAVEGIERLYEPSTVRVSAEWKGGRGSVAGLRIESLPR